MANPPGRLVSIVADSVTGDQDSCLQVGLPEWRNVARLRRSGMSALALLSAQS